MPTYITTNESGAILAYADWQFPDSVEVDFEVVRGVDGKLYKSGEEPKPLSPTIEERTEHFRAAIQSRLDVFARTRNYDSITTAASYANSAVDKFRVEGQYACTIRDATWVKAYKLLAEWTDAIQSGQRGFPTDDEIFNELPALEWPNP